MKPRIYRRHPLNMFFGRATIAEGVRKQNSHPFKVMQKENHVDCVMVMRISHMHPTLVKAIYLLCDMCDRDFMLINISCRR